LTQITRRTFAGIIPVAVMLPLPALQQSNRQKLEALCCDNGWEITFDYAWSTLDQKYLSMVSVGLGSAAAYERVESFREVDADVSSVVDEQCGALLKILRDGSGISGS